MASSVNSKIKVGQKVIVTQQVPKRDNVWTTHIEGKVLSYRQSSTGSWFASSKHDKLWLDRIEIQRVDGEIVVCNLDQYSHIEFLSDDE